MPVCTKCGAEMQQGFIIDKTYGDRVADSPDWTNGVPESSFWTGIQLRGRKRHPVVTFRCPQCGFLESYAPAE